MVKLQNLCCDLCNKVRSGRHKPLGKRLCLLLVLVDKYPCCLSATVCFQINNVDALTYVGQSYGGVGAQCLAVNGLAVQAID